MGYDGTSKSKNLKNILKRLLIVEIITYYIVVLTIISHVRGPEKYQRDPAGPVWTASDFSCFDDTGRSRVQEDKLHMENTTAGHNIIFQTEVNMIGSDGFYINFFIDCPPEYQETHLAVDLFNEEAGCDEGNVEYMHTLSEGENKIVCELFPQENVPGTAFMRIFTSDSANYNVQDLQIYSLCKAEKVSVSMILTLVLMVVAMVITGVILRRSWVKDCG